MNLTEMGTPSATRINKQILRDLLTGACLAGICAALVLQFYPGFWKKPPVAAHEMALQRRQALQEGQQQAARAAIAAVQPVGVQGPCEIEPLIPPSDPRDGHASVEHPSPGGPRAKAKVFLRQAEAAAARRRLRDAEVALLAACRENDAASAEATVPLARVLGMLGDRYVAAAGAVNSSVLREQLMARADHVFSLSAQAYGSALGLNASRSRQARHRLAMLEQELLAAADVPQPRADRLHDDAAPVKPKAAERSRKAPPSKTVSVRGGRTDPQTVGQWALPAQATQRPDPEQAEKRVSLESQADLGQLASNVVRLQAQAEAVSDDPAGFRRRAGVAQAERDRCQDAACAREWYAKRRRELLMEF